MKTAIAVVLLLGVPTTLHALEKDNSLPRKAESTFLKGLEVLEAAKTDQGDAVDDVRWVLRSRHFVFGMPRLTDDRHDFIPGGFTEEQAGISVIAREGFVVAHFDRMKAPVWVAQRWTKFDSTRMDETPSQDRFWREDLVLPSYARGRTTYDGNKTKLDRGHMARHAMNRAWGIDTSNFGTKMSNSAPQHRNVNRFGSAWGKLEDEIRNIVTKPATDFEAVWTISGAVYRDATNLSSETPEQDFADLTPIAIPAPMLEQSRYPV